MNWQLISVEQAIELKDMGVVQASLHCFVSAWHDSVQVRLSVLTAKPVMIGSAYNLSEVAAMLGYNFVPSNVKEAGEKLIDELKIGTMKVSDVNARLKEAQLQG